MKRGGGGQRRNKKNKTQNARNLNEVGGGLTDAGINLSPCAAWGTNEPVWMESIMDMRSLPLLISLRRSIKRVRPKQAAYVLLTSEWCIACRDPPPKPPSPPPAPPHQSGLMLERFLVIAILCIDLLYSCTRGAENAGETVVAFYFFFFISLWNGGGHNGPNNTSAGTACRVRATLAPIDSSKTTNLRCAEVYRSACLRLAPFLHLYASCERSDC